MQKPRSQKHRSKFTIKNCFDSHVHWKETGDWAHQIDLNSLTSASDIQKILTTPRNFRGEWLLGWGWDHTKWQIVNLPHRSTLDQHFGKNIPVCFYRTDGHAIWASTEALKRIGVLDSNGNPTESSRKDPQGGLIVRDSAGIPTGILVDLAAEPITKILPPQTQESICDSLLDGAKIFNQAGFTHIRDLSCDSLQWEVAHRLAEQNLLTLAIEQFFNANQPSDFDLALKTALQARREQPHLLRVKGIKVYYDGALGSEGALLSQPYLSRKSSTDPCEYRGLAFMKQSELSEIMIRTWESGLDLAVHCIGDAATHEIVECATQLWSTGHEGRLHLEHIEMARPESLAKLVNRDVHCHMQPCHWLTDRRWIREKVGDLYQYAFPWAKLEQLQIPFDFGSDSPIEKSSVFSTEEALVDSEKNGISPIQSDWKIYHSHPDLDWAPSQSIFAEGSIEVEFLGKKIFPQT